MAITDTHLAFVQSVTSGRFKKSTDVQVFAVIAIADIAEVRTAPEGDGWPKRLLVDLADGRNLALVDGIHHSGWDGAINFLATRLGPPTGDVDSASGWNRLLQHVKSRFTVSDEGRDYIAVTFGIGDSGRSQLAFVTCMTLMEGAEQWAVIQSPIGRRSDIDPVAAVRAIDGVIIGGLAASRDVVMVRHAMPLANFNEAEFEDSIVMVSLVADGLEERLLGSDQF